MGCMLGSSVLTTGKEQKVSVQPDQTVRFDALPDGKLLQLLQEEG